MSSKNEIRSPELQKLEEKLRKDPASKLFFPLAEEYAKVGRVDEAIALLQTGVKAHPDFLGARVALGKVLFSKGQLAEAKQEFEQVIAANPDNLMAHKKLAAIYLKDGEKDRALASCEIILAVNRTDPEVLRLKDEVSRLPDQPGEDEPTVAALTPPSVEMPKDSDAAETFRSRDEAVEPTVVMEPFAVEPDVAEATEVVSFPIEPAVTLAEPAAGDTTVMEPWVEPTVVRETSADEPDVAEATEVVSFPIEPAVTLAEPAAGDTTVMEPWAEPTVVRETSSGEPDVAEATEVMSLPVEPPVAAVFPDDVDVQVVDEPQDDDLGTSSLADLYVAQGHYDQGIAIYRRLLDRTPADGEIAAKLDNALTLERLLAPTPVDADEVKSDVVSHVLGGAAESAIEHADEESQPSVVGAAAGASRHQAAIHRLELWLARIAERRYR